jgi:fatty acyl-CoA reductase
MNKVELEQASNDIIGNFPNTLTFAKRMAEHLLCQSNKVPLIIMRPTMVGASNEEPVPGWIDTLGNSSSIFMQFGLGQLKDMTGNLANIGDLIPVDMVANQSLLSIAQYRKMTVGPNQPLIIHCATSNRKPITWREVIFYLSLYWRRSPYEKQFSKPNVNFY